MLDGISDNMASLAQLGNCGAINEADPATMGYYVIKYLSEQYKLQKNHTIYGQVIKVGELVVKAEYLSIMKSKTSWYWKNNGTNKIVIISTHTIFHPCL